MTYDEVETALRSTERARSYSRSRSVSRLAPSVSVDPSDSSSESSLDNLSEDDYNLDLPSTSGHETDSSNRPERTQNRALSHLAALRAEEASAEAYDMRASKIEEIELWKIMEQEPPDEIIKGELVDEGEQPKRMRESRDGEDWRDRIEPMGVWEMFREPVPDEAFKRNRGRKSKSARRREERGAVNVDHVGSEKSQDDSLDRLVVESEAEDEEEDEGSADQADIDESDDENSTPERPQQSNEGPVARHRSPSEDSEMSEQEADVKIEEWD
jgi:hypothetical protein